MTNFYFNKLDFISLIQFERFSRQNHLKEEKNLHIYLEESEEGDLAVAFRLKDMISDLIHNRGFKVNIYLSHAGNAGMVVFLAVPAANRHFAGYGTIRLQFTPLPDSQKDLEFINKFGDISLPIIPEFLHNLKFIKLMLAHTSFTYDDFEKAGEHLIDAQSALKENLVADTYEIFLTPDEALYYAEYVRENEKLIYRLPEPYQSKMEKILDDYNEIIITRNEMQEKIYKEGIAFLERK